MTVARVVAMARVRLALCEILESIPAAEASAMLRSIASEIDGEAPALREAHAPESPPAEVAAPTDPPRPGPTYTANRAPDLRVVGAPQRSTLLASPYQRLFRQPAPVKVAILEYLATQSEPVVFRQITEHLRLARITVDDASASQSLREMKISRFVNRVGEKKGAFTWEITDLARSAQNPALASRLSRAALAATLGSSG